jgi:hypothetical protein
MSKNPFINAFAASSYILFVVTIMNFMTQRLSDKPDTFFAPVTVLFMLTLSVAVMGFLFFYQPLLFVIEGKRKEAINLFVKTVGIFAVFTIIISILLFLGLI